MFEGVDRGTGLKEKGSAVSDNERQKQYNSLPSEHLMAAHKDPNLLCVLRLGSSTTSSLLTSHGSQPT